MTRAGAISEELRAVHALLEESMRHWGANAAADLVSTGPLPAILVHGHGAAELAITQAVDGFPARWRIEERPDRRSGSPASHSCPSILSLLRTVRHLLDLEPDVAFKVRMGAPPLPQ